MNLQNYLIDTNVFIGLEDDKQVNQEVASFLALANKHNIGVFVHEAAKDDIARDSDAARRAVSLSKLDKFQTLSKVRDLGEAGLAERYGDLTKPNDVVDATLLHALDTGAVDFLITEDRGLHSRARRHASHLSRRVLFIADAAALLISTYEPVAVPFRYVEEVSAHQIPADDDIFDSLKEGYPGFENWWKKCVRDHRQCWAVYDNGLAGLIVRKDETQQESDATLPGQKILKLCTFKVRPEKRGVKLGELLLKQALWFAQSNRYDVVYLTTQPEQQSLIDLIEYYGFEHTTTLDADELVFEKPLSPDKVQMRPNEDTYTVVRRHYPKFYVGPEIGGYIIPIRELYHDILFPELKDDPQGSLFSILGMEPGPKSPGNTIRKVYLCRAQSNIKQPGSILFFYKGRSNLPPSQSITTIGILEDMLLAESLTDLMRLAGGRSVYSEADLRAWGASPEHPVKVINFLLAGYITPPVGIQALKADQVFGNHPPQSICKLTMDKLRAVLSRSQLGFDT